MNYFTTEVSGKRSDGISFHGARRTMCREIALRGIRNLVLTPPRTRAINLLDLRTCISINGKKHMPFPLFEEIEHHTGVKISIEERRDELTDQTFPWIVLEGGEELHYPAWYWVVLAARFTPSEVKLGMLGAMQKSPRERWDYAPDKPKSIFVWNKLVEERYSPTSEQMIFTGYCPIDYYIFTVGRPIPIN